ncbi:HEPN domain-containing protein [Parapedobacter deserti]|uniref:HEPN domain-containing protein n=1 Tax=Parapedobacter deserti TaxID=1912957 RepID=A0ABV7JRL1_9SPHI
MNLLSHLPEEKQKEILAAVEIIKEEANPEKIILFGSHATGKWVDSSYVEDGIKLSYISDYDFLVVLSDDKKDQETSIASHIENRCNDFEGIVSPAPHTISYINHGLSFGQFFFMRIINEGILLYDTGNTEFVKPKILTPEEQKKKAQDYFDLWFPNGDDFLTGANFYLTRDKYRLCAFSLHQAAENFYATALLVFEGYKPTMHGLQKMRNYSKHLSRELYTLFLTPPEDAHQTHLFDLLKRGYIEARYKPNYNITREECEELIAKLTQMKEIVKRICTEKIQSIK